jgi:hypothetical protein
MMDITSAILAKVGFEAIQVIIGFEEERGSLIQLGIGFGKLKFRE